MMAAMDKFLRDWRRDALNRNQYEAAIFAADKLVAITGMLHQLVVPTEPSPRLDMH